MACLFLAVDGSDGNSDGSARPELSSRESKVYLGRSVCRQFHPCILFVVGPTASDCYVSSLVCKFDNEIVYSLKLWKGLSEG